MTEDFFFIMFYVILLLAASEEAESETLEGPFHSEEGMAGTKCWEF